MHTGINDERQSADWVRGMFGQIAGRYDLLNHLLSFNIDRYWRYRTVKRIGELVPDQRAKILDLACGTADILISLEKKRRSPAIGGDFCHPMLTAAAGKIQRAGLKSTLFEGDGLQLPLRDNSLDAITIGFGFRNFANYDKGLREMLRVLKPGGVVAILEFSQPDNRAFRGVYDWFSNTLMPRIGGLISGSRQAYSYLPASIRKFPDAPSLAAQMKREGFSRVAYELMTFGSVALHLGWK